MSGDERSVEAANYHRLLFEQAGMAMVAADCDGRITAWNHAARRMFGAGPNEMRGTDWTHLIPLHERETAASLMNQALRNGAVGEFEFALRDEHGANRRLAAIVTPIADPSGNPIGGLACVRDITNRTILQDRLAQQSKMAALGQMAGALAHHFNNILGGVVTSIDFALDSSDPDFMHRALEKTATALPRATDLVENLLAFAEGDFRDASLCDLGEVILDIIEETENRLKRSPIELKVDFHHLPVLEVPRSALHTVLANLIDNAVEAMPRGGTLTIRVRATATHVVIGIADTGVGLDEESLKRIFEPFFSTKAGLETGKRGRGLGLAVAHGILKVLSGSVNVTTSLGHGTEFEVKLPLKPRDDRG